MPFPFAFPYPFGGGSGPGAVLDLELGVGPEFSTVVTPLQIVNVHTGTGVRLYQFTPDQYTSLTWTRDQRDASRVDLIVPPMPDIDVLPDIVEWRDWISVYDGERNTLLWTGPVRSVRGNRRRGFTLQARDHSAFLSRTRNPMTKRWDAADPSWIARELWAAMIEAQGLPARALARPDPEGERYDFQVITDDQMLDQTIGQLVDLGLRWTVVSGVPILGPLSLDPIAVLGEDDFLGDGIDFVRDGSAVYNDVLVRGPDNLARAHVDYHGQNLQTIVNVDNMFGVSNVKKAAQAYVRHTGAVRTRLELPATTVLHPNAPVSIDELMPSTRFVIEAQGIRQLMELVGVQVVRTAGSATVGVTMESVEEKPELARDVVAPNVTLGGVAAR